MLNAVANKSLLSTLIREPLTFFGGLLLFLMTFSPSYNVGAKVILIAVLVVAIIISRIIYDKLNVTPTVLLWYGIFIVHGIFFTVVGLFYRNNISYILRTTTYNIIWPVFYLIFTIGLYKKTSLSFIVKVLVLSNFFIAVYIIASTLTLFGLLPNLPFLTFEMARQDYDTLQGLVKTQTPSVVSLLYTVPFVLGLSILDKTRKFGFSKLFYNISVVLSIIAIICTARRALILNVILGFFFTVFIVQWCKKVDKKAFNATVLKILFWGLIVLMLALISAQQLGLFDYMLVYEKFTSAFSSQGGEDASTSVRYEQFSLLIKSWLQNPILGHGHGAVSSYMVRSEKSPWVYELSYVALLFQTGIVGLLAYLALLVWPIIKGLQLIRYGSYDAVTFIVPAIVGWCCFLIANGTNPYLISYDYMWALFFPLAVINYFSKQSISGAEEG